MNNVVYIDLDGVLFDFEAHYEAVTGRQLTFISDEEKETLFDYDFFENIPFNAHFLLELRELFPDAELRVLSSVGTINTQEVIDGKMAALSIHAPELAATAVFALKSKDKAEMVGVGGNVLIDDRMKALEPWIAAGGIGYQYDIRTGALTRV
jgi:hypothetical protein